MTYTLFTYIYCTHRHHTSEVSSHLFIQAVELLSVFESGGMWHSPVAGSSTHGGHHRGGWGSGAERQSVATQKYKLNKRSFNNQPVCFLQFRRDGVDKRGTDWEKNFCMCFSVCGTWQILDPAVMRPCSYQHQRRVPLERSKAMQSKVCLAI